MANNIDDHLKHWSAWSRDDGNWRQTCCSFERFYVLAQERYKFADDHEKQYRFKYDQRIAEKVEKIIVKLPKMEKMVLIAAYVYCPHLKDEQVAKKLNLPTSSYKTFLTAGIYHFRRDYGL